MSDQPDQFLRRFVRCEDGFAVWHIRCRACNQERNVEGYFSREFFRNLERDFRQDHQTCHKEKQA